MRGVGKEDIQIIYCVYNLSIFPHEQIVVGYKLFLTSFQRVTANGRVDETGLAVTSNFEANRKYYFRDFLIECLRIFIYDKLVLYALY